MARNMRPLTWVHFCISKRPRSLHFNTLAKTNHGKIRSGNVVTKRSATDGKKPLRVSIPSSSGERRHELSREVQRREEKVFPSRLHPGNVVTISRILIPNFQMFIVSIPSSSGERRHFQQHAGQQQGVLGRIFLSEKPGRYPDKLVIIQDLSLAVTPASSAYIF